MPDVWMPGAIIDPGAGANYPAGRNRLTWLVHHDTGGTNSHDICKWGRAGYGNSLCNWLFPKEGPPFQFAPIDALTYHAGSPSDYDRDGDSDDYNPYGPGAEVERLQGEPLTDDQTLWLGRLGLFAAEWGIPFVQYRGPFGGADEPTLFHGHVNHRDLHPNPDGLSPEEWDAIMHTTGGSTPDFTSIGGARMIAVCHIQGHTDLFTVAADNKVWWKHNAGAASVLTVNGNAKFPEITKDGEQTIFFRGPDKADGSPQFVKAVDTGFGWSASWA